MTVQLPSSLHIRVNNIQEREKQTKMPGKWCRSIWLLQQVPNSDNTDVQDFEEVKLGDDEYYVMGDNRPYSKDSRYVGPVKKSQLFAKKMLVLLPISDIGVKD